MLDELGISERDERLYRELLRRSAASASASAPASGDADPAGLAGLAEALGLDAARLRAGLDRLVEAGFLLPDGTAFRPVPPAAAIRALVHRRQAELHTRAAALERAHAAADDVATRILVSVPGPVTEHTIETVVGRSEIGRRVGEVVASATQEILVLDRPPYARPGQPGRSAIGERELLDRGVDMRVVFAADGLDLPGRMASIAELVEAGMGARVATVVPTKLVIVDRRVAVLPPSDVTDPTESALIVREAMLLNALVPLFDATWDRATPIGATAGEDLTPDERRLLALLGSGLKDEAIGRQLGVHVHTARRRIARLLERLDSASRFQAGIHAVRRGWLD